MSPAAIHYISTNEPTSSPGNGDGWLVSASLRPNGGNFTYRITCASPAG